MLLSGADVTRFNIFEQCSKFMASDEHKIPLFSKKILNNLSTCNSHFHLKMILLPYMTWLDHSILKRVVSASKNEVALKKLEEFDSSIQYTQPISSYPLSAPSQLIIPLAASDHTVIATKYALPGTDTTLEYVKNIKLLLTKIWQITEHSIQLVAVNEALFYLYWLIPKTVASLIEDQNSLNKVQHQLLDEGIIMTSIFPDEVLDKKLPNLAGGPFHFLTLYMQDNIMVRCIQTIY